MKLMRPPKTSQAASLATGAELVKAVEGMQFSEASKATMSSALRAWARALGQPDPKAVAWHRLSIDDIQAARAKMLRRLTRGDGKPAPATLRLRFAAMRLVLKAARQRRLVDQQHCDDVADLLRRVPGSRLPKGRALTDAEVTALLKACDRDRQPRGAMLRAILLIALGTGMRRAEICKLAVECFDGRAIHVVAKGDHEVQHFLTPATKRALEEWLRVRRSLRWNHQWLFASPVSGTPLRPWHLWYLFVGRDGDGGLCQLASVRQFSPHDLRRSFATRMFTGGLGTSVVQKLMKHKDQRTTTLYDRRGDDELDAERLKVADYEPREARP